MKRKQIATLVNQALQETIGETAIVNDDLSNIVDIGKTLPDSTSVNAVYSSIFDKIGKTIVESPNAKKGLNLKVDDWEYGEILEKIRIEIPEAEENPSWSLTKGTSYDCFKFSPLSAKAKYFTFGTTFEVDLSVPDVQMKDSFRDASSMNTFIDHQHDTVRKAMNSYSALMEYRCLNNMIGLMFHKNHGIVDLLAKWNAENAGTQLTKDNCMANADFKRFCAKTIKLYGDYISDLSMLYNADGYPTQTEEADKRQIFLADFIRELETSSFSTTYNDGYLKLGDYTTVSDWQGSGTDGSFKERSKIDVTVKIDDSGSTAAIKKQGIVGVLFDIRGCCINRRNYRVLSNPVPKGEFTNFYYKFDASYINDTAENFIVFTIGDGTVEG